MQAMHRKVDEAKIGPGVELRDPVRLELLRRLQGLLGANQQVSRGAQAALLLCDIRYLEEQCQVLDNGVETGTGNLRYLLSNPVRENDIVSKWCQKPDLSSTTSSARARSLRRNNNPEPSPLQQAMPSTEPQVAQEQESRPLKRKQSAAWSASTGSSKSRSHSVRQKCKERDDFKCIVTKSAGPVDAAHIFPNSLNESDSRANFLGLLRQLWVQRIGKWESRLKNGTEFVENELTLSPSLHWYHSKGLFGLQPIEATSDGKSLKLGFYWLDKRQTGKSSEMVDLMDIPTLAHDFQPKDIAICSSRDEHIIRSGEVIELITEDPEKRPLPDWDLLEMQWVLQRLTALKGAADVPDTILDDSDDNDCEESTCLGYEEMEQDDDSSEECDEHEESWRRARLNDWVGQIQPQTCV
ncbi:hypothetical protein TEQG_02181 [Trichophyton equinum CBS 127.97]|uniref:HNH nuclease domain-containing protein n=1 Tax=Trichophyton equinum (strain ATCC MYA-4606 / CBS 127.97) TaxID=559882 RepID=F2PM65_TRIEC|nr:hypothetical protein TEQG_02181 [Trichophyton equinum CBS 127.97]